jgi:hypothetical protein
VSYAPRHRPRATSYDALVEPPRRRRPSAWLVGVAALGIIAALANAFPQQVSRAWHALRDGAHADAPARPVARDSVAPTPTPVESVAAAPMASESRRLHLRHPPWRRAATTTPTHR